MIEPNTPIDYVGVVENASLFMCCRVTATEWECGACRKPIFWSQLEDGNVCQCGRKIVWSVDTEEVRWREKQERVHEIMIEYRRTHP